MHDGVFSAAYIEYTLMVHRVQLAWGEAGP